MRITLKRVAFSALGIYLLITCYTGFMLFKKKLGATSNLNEKEGREDRDWNPWGQDFNLEGIPQGVQPPELHVEWQDLNTNNTDPRPGDAVVEIWGKAAIGQYLWQHILTGTLEEKIRGVWSYGTKRFGNIIFRYRTGPGVVPAKVPQETRFLVLVLNGREPSKVHYSQMWLDYLPQLPNLQKTILVILGNEKCNNSWVHKYLLRNGGLVSAVFLVYDSPEIDNKVFFQWPLGVATYRSFPHVKMSDIPWDKERDYLCNFMGTIYRNSSREKLLQITQENNYQEICYIKPRLQWLAQETDKTRESYIRSLAQSDFTLNPVGMNSECYRIYEAMAFGSIPIIEDAVTPGYCAQQPKAPLRLLKQHRAPVIYVKSWHELIDIMDREQDRPLEDIYRRRKELLLWYESFKNKMKDQFLRVVRTKFFSKGNLKPVLSKADNFQL